MPTQNNAFLQFNYVPYPLWERKQPNWLQAFTRPLLDRFYPTQNTQLKHITRASVADYLVRFQLIPSLTPSEIGTTLEDSNLPVETVEPTLTPEAYLGTVRLPAQWEKLETILLAFPVNFPPLWHLHAQMIAAIVTECAPTVHVPHVAWAHGIALFLQTHYPTLPIEKVRFLQLPTNDIWIRDYGPFVGHRPDGGRAVIKMTYDPLDNYPQERDDAMAGAWARHHNLPMKQLPFHGEGGNVWTDGEGTLIMTAQAFLQNPHLNRPSLESVLREGFSFEKLILIPRLRFEETGHVDLLTKLINRDSILITEPKATFTADRQRAATGLLASETNARGERYQLIPLPNPPFYVNWFGFPIRRSYTNALTVNGKVLVPTYQATTDDRALRIYEEAFPNHLIAPIDCSIGANGGGAVHCLTKEVAL